ncbi:MAG: hypothetical protein Q9187_005368, partial [Circinaria calcarea]
MEAVTVVIELIKLANALKEASKAASDYTTSFNEGISILEEILISLADPENQLPTGEYKRLTAWKVRAEDLLEDLRAQTRSSIETRGVGFSKAAVATYRRLRFDSKKAERINHRMIECLLSLNTIIIAINVPKR